MAEKIPVSQYWNGDTFITEYSDGSMTEEYYGQPGGVSSASIAPEATGDPEREVVKQTVTNGVLYTYYSDGSYTSGRLTVPTSPNIPAGDIIPDTQETVYGTDLEGEPVAEPILPQAPPAPVAPIPVTPTPTPYTNRPPPTQPPPPPPTGNTFGGSVWGMTGGQTYTPPVQKRILRVVREGDYMVTYWSDGTTTKAYQPLNPIINRPAPPPPPIVETPDSGVDYPPVEPETPEAPVVEPPIDLPEPPPEAPYELDRRPNSDGTTTVYWSDGNVTTEGIPYVPPEEPIEIPEPEYVPPEEPEPVIPEEPITVPPSVTSPPPIQPPVVAPIEVDPVQDALDRGVITADEASDYEEWLNRGFTEEQWIAYKQVIETPQEQPVVPPAEPEPTGAGDVVEDTDTNIWDTVDQPVEQPTVPEIPIPPIEPVPLIEPEMVPVPEPFTQEAVPVVEEPPFVETPDSGELYPTDEDTGMSDGYDPGAIWEQEQQAQPVITTKRRQDADGSIYYDYYDEQGNIIKSVKQGSIEYGSASATAEGAGTSGEAVWDSTTGVTFPDVGTGGVPVDSTSQVSVQTTPSAEVTTPGTPPPTTPPPTAAPAGPPAPAYEYYTADDPLAIQHPELVGKIKSVTMNGNTQTYDSYWSQLFGIEQPQTWNQWQGANAPGYVSDVTQTEAGQGLQDITEQFANPEQTLAGDQTQSQELMAQQLGYGSYAEYQQALQGYRGGADAALAGAQNLTPQQQEATDRYLNNQRRSMENTQQRQLDAILSGATGNSTRRALMQSNEFINQIEDQQLQSQMSLAQMYLTQNLEVFDRNLQMYQDAMDRGQLSTQDFMTRFTQSREDALEGYAKQVDEMLLQNDQYLKSYGQELDRVREAADITINSVMAQMGVDQQITAQVQQEFNNYWQAFYADLAKQGLISQEDAIDAQKEVNNWTKAGTFISAGIGIIWTIAKIFALTNPVTAPLALVP